MTTRLPTLAKAVSCFIPRVADVAADVNQLQPRHLLNSLSQPRGDPSNVTPLALPLPLPLPLPPSQPHGDPLGVPLPLPQHLAHPSWPL